MKMVLINIWIECNLIVVSSSFAESSLKRKEVIERYEAIKKYEKCLEISDSDSDLPDAIELLKQLSCNRYQFTFI